MEISKDILLLYISGCMAFSILFAIASAINTARSEWEMLESSYILNMFGIKIAKKQIVIDTIKEFLKSLFVSFVLVYCGSVIFWYLTFSIYLALTSSGLL